MSPLHREPGADMVGSAALCTGPFRASAALNPLEGASWALVHWRFESIPDLELRRAPLSRVLLSSLWTALLRPLPALPDSEPSPRLRKPRIIRSCPKGPPPLHYAPQFAHTSFAATSTHHGRHKPHLLRTPDSPSPPPYSRPLVMNNQQQQQAQQAQQQGNRLNLAFGFNGGGDRQQFQNDGRAYPTTPSTFPQPVHQQEVWGAQQGNGYGNGYFMNPYQQAQYQGQQGNLQAPGAGRFNDAANGLAQQFQQQHLGGSGRSGSPYGGRQSSPNQQRPRTADNRGYQYGGGYGHQPRSPSLNDEEPPPKTPEKYSDNVLRQAKVSINLVSTFFKDSVQRARDRNQRCANSRVYERDND